MHVAHDMRAFNLKVLSKELAPLTEKVWYNIGELREKKFSGETFEKRHGLPKITKLLSPRKPEKATKRQNNEGKSINTLLYYI